LKESKKAKKCFVAEQIFLIISCFITTFGDSGSVRVCEGFLLLPSQAKKFSKTKVFCSLLQPGCQIFLGAKYQNGKNITNNHKIYQMSIKCTKWPQNIPNGRQIDQTAIKYTKWPYNIGTYQHLLLQDLPNVPEMVFLV
jgi:hypothetical protein